MKKNLQTEHDFSLTSGQIVGLIAGQVVIVLLAFVAGLLVGRYDMARELVTLARQRPEQAATAVPLARPTGLGARTRKPAVPKVPARTTPPAAKRTAALPGKPTADTSAAPKVPAKPTPPTPKKPATTKPASAPVKRPTKPAPPQKTPIAGAEKPQPPPPAKKPAVKSTAAEPKKPDAPRGEAKFSIQVFASRNAQDTRDYVAKLQKTGFDAWVIPASSDKWHRAVIGRYPTGNEAFRVLKELKQQKEFTDAWVRPLR